MNPLKEDSRERQSVATLTSHPMILATILSGSFACTPSPPAKVAPLLYEARQNEVAAFAKNREQELRVEGVVLQIGMDAVQNVAVDGYAPGSFVSLTARKEVAHYPYVLVADYQTPSPDLVKCQFSPSDAKTVGQIRPGARITVGGTFDRYLHNQGQLIMLLGRCSVE
jgi:hypothetical protein